jgi:threonine/homoserine/homoserine lactone efflux protein
MSPAIIGSVFLAGFVYAVTPGPGVLAVLGIGAARGRLAAAKFLGGHCAGDIVWYILATASIIGVSSIGERVFQVLGLVSGIYLIYLGILALRHGRGGVVSALVTRDPLKHGLVFGLTNPKAYPVAAAMFTALLAGNAAQLSWYDLPMIVAVATFGSLAGDAVYVYAVGISTMRRFYERHEIALNRVSGAIFFAFGGKAIYDSLR